MQHIDHPSSFKDGCRVLLLKGRLKDNPSSRKTLTRITHDEEQFDKALEELRYLAYTNQRIYGSAGRRDIAKATRLFKQRQLDADYDNHTDKFYMNLEARWTSCVQAVKAQESKRWLFDCDCDEDREIVEEQLSIYYDRPYEPYWYETKNGHHCIVEPFNKALLTDNARSLIHDNALILWSF